MGTNVNYLENLNSAFDEIHDNLTTIRNYIGCFYKLCVDKIAEYEPNKHFEDELVDYIKKLFDDAIKEGNKVDKDTLNRCVEDMMKKYGINPDEYLAKQSEQIANGTKLGVELGGIQEKLDFYIKAQKMLLVNGLENMITSFEDFLANIFSCHYRQYDSILDNKTITFKEIRDTTCFEDIKTSIVKNEVENLLHKSVDELFKIICKEIGLKLNYFSKNKVKFLEIFYRRNIFIHNKGIVNETYISNSKNPYKLEKGKYAGIGVDYLYDAVSMLLLVSAEIVTEIISKLKIEQGTYKERESVISSIAFHNYLCREDWEFALNFYDILSENNHLSATSVDMYKLNMMLCKKKLGQLKTQTIKKEKWDNKTPFLKSGYYALTEEYDKMESIIFKYRNDDDNKIEPDSLKTWPIFIDYRTNEKERYENFLNKLEKAKQKIKAIDKSE